MDQPSSTESNALTLRIKFKSASLDDFISRYGVDVSPGGIFIRTKQPVDVGTSLQFEFLLVDGSPLLTGLGTVAWVRENDPARSNNVPGMGLRFDKLTPDSQAHHQTILAEKARKEGRPQGTPYPPTAFVAPATRPPTAETIRATAPASAGATELNEEATKPGAVPVNFAKTLPAPAALASRLQQSLLKVGPEEESDEFDGGGKTEISDKPLDFYLQDAEAAQKAPAGPAGPVSAAASTDDFAPKASLDDWKTDAHTLEGINQPPAPEEVSITDSQAYAMAAPSSTSLPVGTSGERQPADKDFFSAMLNDDAPSEHAHRKQDTEESASGVPIEETVPEKTEELSLSDAKGPDEMDAPIDLGGPTSENEVVEPPIPSLGDIPFPEKKRRRGSAVLIGGVVIAGVAAFAAVYLWQAKPWQTTAPAAPAPIVKKLPPAPPAPVVAAPTAPEPKAAEAPGKAAAEPKAAPTEPVAVKEEKPAPEKSAAEKKAEEKAAAKSAAEKKAEEKALAEKAAAEKKAEEKAAAEKAAAEKKSEGAKPGAKPKGAAKPVVAGAETEGEKPAAAGEREEVYRLAFRSSPIGAEVLIDGEYFARTPCERRILDPKKTYAITIRKEGYEPHERMIGSSDNWAKKGDGEHVLAISVALKKAKPAEPAAPKAEDKPAPKPAPDEPDKI